MISKEYVFISYARENFKTAKRLYDNLKQAGLTPWMDTEDILPGQNWKYAINQAIRKSSHFLALLSSHSISKKGYVQKELRKALDILEEIPPDEIFIIPVRLNECEPMHERLRELNWVDIFRSYEVALDKILRVIMPESQYDKKMSINLLHKKDTSESTKQSTGKQENKEGNIDKQTSSPLIIRIRRVQNLIKKIAIETIKILRKFFFALLVFIITIITGFFVLLLFRFIQKSNSDNNALIISYILFFIWFGALSFGNYYLCKKFSKRFLKILLWLEFISFPVLIHWPISIDSEWSFFGYDQIPFLIVGPICLYLLHYLTDYLLFGFLSSQLSSVYVMIDFSSFILSITLFYIYRRFIFKKLKQEGRDSKEGGQSKKMNILRLYKHNRLK